MDIVAIFYICIWGGFVVGTPLLISLHIEHFVANLIVRENRISIPV